MKVVAYERQTFFILDYIDLPNKPTKSCRVMIFDTNICSIKLVLIIINKATPHNLKSDLHDSIG